MNLVMMMGYVCSDPVKYETDKTVCVRYRIGVKTPSRNDKDDFFNVVAFKDNATWAFKYVKKGSHLIVRGQLHNTEYTDDDQVKHYGDEIVVDDRGQEFVPSGKRTNADGSVKADAAESTETKSESSDATKGNSWIHEKKEEEQEINAGFLTAPEGMDEGGNPFNE